MPPCDTTTVALVNAGLVNCDWASVMWEWGGTLANRSLNEFDPSVYAPVATKVLAKVLGVAMEDAAKLYNAGVLVETVFPKESTGCNFGLSIGTEKTNRAVGKVSAALTELSALADGEADEVDRLTKKAARSLAAVMSGNYQDTTCSHQLALVDVMSNLALCSCYVGPDLAYSVLIQLAAADSCATPTSTANAVALADVCVVLEAGEMQTAPFSYTKMHMEPDQFDKTNMIGFLTSNVGQTAGNDVQFINRRDMIKGVKGVSPKCKFQRCSAILFNRSIVVVAWHAKATRNDYPSLFVDAAEQLLASARDTAKRQFGIVDGQHVPCVLFTDSNLQTSDDANEAAYMLDGSNTLLFNDQTNGAFTRRLTSYGTTRNKGNHQPKKWLMARNKAGMMVVADSSDAPVACNVLPISKFRPVSTPSFVKNDSYPYEHTPIDASFRTPALVLKKPAEDKVLFEYFVRGFVLIALLAAALLAASESV